jgi:hypothetical protein
MSGVLNPISFVVACLSGWLNQQQQYVVDYRTEENRIERPFYRSQATSLSNPYSWCSPPSIGFAAIRYSFGMRCLFVCSSPLGSVRSGMPGPRLEYGPALL